MAYELISERNMTEGLHVPFVYINDITNGLFIRLLIFAVWIIIAMGIYFNQRKSTGSGDFPTGTAVAGFVTLGFTIILRLIPGLVDGWTVAVVFIVALIGVLWLLFSRKDA